jgi:cell division protein FtsQ
MSVFEQDFGRSVFTIALAERRRRLLAIDWVEDASVTRILPDRLLVRIRERKPVAFAVLHSGAMLVDASGVLLEPPEQGRLAFPALNGLSLEDTEAQRRERVQSFLNFQRDMGYLANEISELDVSNPTDLSAVTQVGGRAVELLLGGGDFARRYQAFVNNYSEIHSQSPEATVFDLRLDGRIAVR